MWEGGAQLTVAAAEPCTLVVRSGGSSAGSAPALIHFQLATSPAPAEELLGS